jgi:MazG family protein
MTDEEMIHCSEKERQIERLRAIMHRLRAPGGCSWDAEQTHASLVPNLIEEAYETVDTIQRGDLGHLQEELGDLLLQVVFHSEMASEGGSFDFDTVAQGISEKLVRRHPHVFATSEAADSESVLKQWDEIKRAEKGDEEEPFLHGVGKGLPALLRAAKLQKKASKVGFDWGDTEGVIDKIREELGEVEEELSGAGEKLEEELGDLMFSMVNLMRFLKKDPEVVLANANKKFEKRFGGMEQGLLEEGSSLEAADLGEMERQWLVAKEREKMA